jgi:two-component system sensor histidine kinase/response regulator
MHFADEGPGIPENQRTLVFEKYGTLQNAREDVRQVGLGLYFCKLAVESHGGSIDVQPNEPRGSIFTVRLPIASAVDGASAEM